MNLRIHSKTELKNIYYYIIFIFLLRIENKYLAIES